jgi:hypothetical protein
MPYSRCSRAWARHASQHRAGRRTAHEPWLHAAVSARDALSTWGRTGRCARRSAPRPSRTVARSASSTARPHQSSIGPLHARRWTGRARRRAHRPTAACSAAADGPPPRPTSNRSATVAWAEARSGRASSSAPPARPAMPDPWVGDSWISPLTHACPDTGSHRTRRRPAGRGAGRTPRHRSPPDGLLSSAPSSSSSSTEQTLRSVEGGGVRSGSSHGRLRPRRRHRRAVPAIGGSSRPAIEAWAACSSSTRLEERRSIDGLRWAARRTTGPRPPDRAPRWPRSPRPAPPRIAVPAPATGRPAA